MGDQDLGEDFWNYFNEADDLFLSNWDLFLGWFGLIISGSVVIGTILLGGYLILRMVEA